MMKEYTVVERDTLEKRNVLFYIKTERCELNFSLSEPGGGDEENKGIDFPSWKIQK